ncbi:hypothetical protein [Ramlibacter sp. AN1133]|uniref:hypothetical protein n=1 Tax=Ramlibacter sp. AN1133 TaxID=3133429 RepID=UPI0030C60DEB
MKPGFHAFLVAPAPVLGGLSATSTSASGTENASCRCGGIGQKERARFKQAAHDHDAPITFSTRSGACLAMSISDSDLQGRNEASEDHRRTLPASIPTARLLSQHPGRTASRHEHQCEHPP